MTAGQIAEGSHAHGDHDPSSVKFSKHAKLLRVKKKGRVSLPTRSRESPHYPGEMAGMVRQCK